MLIPLAGAVELRGLGARAPHKNIKTSLL